MREDLSDFSREQLLDYIEHLSKMWLAIDGTWFQAIEKEYGLDKAIDIDVKQWKRFTIIEAKRIMDLLRLPEKGGIPALIQALKFRVYANINVQEIIEISENRCVFRMNNCRVQYARKSRNLPDFPCKPVGLVEYGDFAKTIDSRIETNCISCPPDSHPEEYYCAWEFVLEE
ncbi:MAG: DUF6125 family protein [Candidatus Heimdallarchaeota archaeon]